MLSTPEELMDYLPRPFKYAIMQFDYLPASDFNIDSFIAQVRTDMTQAYWSQWLEEFSSGFFLISRTFQNECTVLRKWKLIVIAGAFIRNP